MEDPLPVAVWASVSGRLLKPIVAGWDFCRTVGPEIEENVVEDQTDHFRHRGRLEGGCHDVSHLSPVRASESAPGMPETTIEEAALRQPAGLRRPNDRRILTHASVPGRSER